VTLLYSQLLPRRLQFVQLGRCFTGSSPTLKIIGIVVVAEALGIEVPPTRARHRALIGAQEFGHFLRVEPRRERRRPDQINKHHGELAALSFREWQACSGECAPGGGERDGVLHRALTQGGSRSK
jgi:hypothetical protein